MSISFEIRALAIDIAYQQHINTHTHSLGHLCFLSLSLRYVCSETSTKLSETALFQTLSPRPWNCVRNSKLQR
eukprot:s348_g20.t1